MSSLDEIGMLAQPFTGGSASLIEVRATEGLAPHCPTVLAELVELTAAVNRRYVRSGSVHLTSEARPRHASNSPRAACLTSGDENRKAARSST